MTKLPPAIEPEIFRGYTSEDLTRLEALQGHGLSEPGSLVDWFGLKISADYAPWIADRAGEVLDLPPVPTDTFLAEGIEYAALALALDGATGDRFTALELGAGWGPWTALSAVCARRKGIKNITIGAFEADRDRFAQLRKHLANNSVVPIDAPDRGQAGDVAYILEQAAIWWEDTTLHWPVSIAADSGRAAAAEAGDGQDYRGFALDVIPVTARSLTTVLAGYERVDFLHIDIQGSEAEVVPKSVEAIEDKVAIMFIGTHSRKIEGDLLEFLYLRDWKLLREQPCVFDAARRSPKMSGVTLRDGGQVWKSPKRA